MAHGTSHGCDEALTPRGRAVGGPRDAQAAHRVRPHAGGDGTTRVHVAARVGRYVVGGEGRYRGPTGIVGPWLVIWGGNANVLPCPGI